MKRSGFGPFALAVFMLLISGCGDKSNSSIQGSSSSGGSTVDPGVEPPKDTAKFYVKVVADKDHPIVTYLHKFNNFSAGCEIDKTESAKDLKCILNVREEDLYFYGLKWEVNIPAGMCAFLSSQTYWYYNHQPGEGPRSIVLTQEAPVQDAAPVITNCSVDGAAGTVSGNYCNFPNGEGAIDASGQAVCAYDYSRGDASLPNCCKGSFSVVSSVQTWDSTGKTTTQTASKGDWGGKYENCMAGPGTDNEVEKSSKWPKTKDGKPITVIRPSIEGMSFTYAIRPPVKVHGSSGNYHAANMYGWSNYRNSTHSAAPIPVGIKPVTDKSGATSVGNKIPDGVEAYTYDCENQSAEIKHKIRIYVNEWNTNEEFAKYIASSDTQGDPEVSGVDGIACDIGGSINYGDCNDFGDWDNLFAALYKFPAEPWVENATP